MPAIKNGFISGAAMVLTAAGLILFNGCTPPGPRALLQGDRLLQEGRPVQAIEKLEHAARLLPKEARAWNYLGLAYHHAGRANDAARAYQQALTLDRNLATARFNLGCLRLEQNNIPAAIQELTSFTGLQPNAAAGWLKLGAAQLRAHQVDAAEKSFRLALRLDARSPEAWNGLGLAQVQRRRYMEACQQFNAALHERPDYAAALLNLAIVSQQHLNGRSFALQKYREFLALKPTPPNAGDVQRIVLQLEQEQRPPVRSVPESLPASTSPAARPSAHPAPVIDKSSPDVNTNKPLAEAAPVPAIAPPVRTAQITSTPPPNPTLVATEPPAKTQPLSVPPPKIEVVQVSDEEPIHAAHDVSSNAPPVTPAPRALTPLDSSPAVAHSVETPKTKNGFLHGINPRNWFHPMETTKAGAPAAGVATQSLSEKQAVATRYKYHSIAVPKLGDRGEAGRLLTQGVRAQEQNRLVDAIATYQQAIQVDPSFFEPRYNLGVAEFEAGNLSQCLLAYEYALAINPISVKARYNFASALQKAGYPRDAANELEKLLADNPSEARAHFALADLYAQRLGEPARAREHYLRLLELDPQHPQATAIRYWLETHP